MIIANFNIEDLPNKIVPSTGYGRNKHGYGRKIATDRMVKLPNSNQWRRVYCCCYSNSGTCYVPNKDGNWFVIN